MRDEQDKLGSPLARIGLGALLALTVIGAGATAQAQIEITSARIGCLDIQTAGNLTALVRTACEGRMTCAYKAPTQAQYEKAGVRAATRSFCTQAMEIKYRCKGSSGSEQATVPGDAWNHPPAQLACRAPVVRPSQPKNAALVPVLQALLRRYERCIVERYETPKTAHLPARDRDKCANGQTCTLASRADAYRRMEQLAVNGDATGFEALLKSAVLGDCMQCGKHAKWHTKHTHCTMDCGGNNGVIEGPCFETCKAGVDINAFMRDFASEVAKHAALFAGNFSGQGAQHVADLESKRVDHASTSFGATVAGNRNLITPTDSEHCDGGTKGFYVVPDDKDLLDWKPAGGGPSWNEFLTGYSPPGTVTPSTFLAPWSAPEVQKTPGAGIGANEGRLRSDLRAVAKAAKPLDALCRSAAAFLGGKHSDGRAFADLSVTGRRAYAAFKSRPPQLADVVACLKADTKLRGRSDAELGDAASDAIERAYRVATVLRAGGWPRRCSEREALGYVAVSGEDDQPHRPVNVPSAEFAQHDLDVTVRGVTVRTRYMIAQTGSASPSCAYRGPKLTPDPAPTLASDAEVIVFIHGMDSRLEESLHLTHVLHKLGEQRKKNYTVIALDMPTSGYADNLDFGRFSALSEIGRATIPPGMMGFAPAAGYKAPLLQFNEDFIVAFLKELARTVPGVTSQLRAVVGGSMGGNLSLRLGRPRTDAPFIKAAVAWSPAGMWASKSDNDVEHIALALPWAFAGGDARFKTEQPWSRNAFFYGGFDWQGKAAFIINVTKPQAQEWYGPSYACRDSAIRLSRIGRYETYDENFRRWHWRLAAEQLIFSHRNLQGGQPLYATNTHRVLLMCGIEDTGGGLCEATRQVAAEMKYTPGHALWLRKTGHSIQDERPNFLGRHIADFITKPAAGIGFDLDVARAGEALSSGASVSPEACRDTCRANAQCRAYSYVRSARVAGGSCALLRRETGKSVNVDAVSGAK